MSRNNSPASIVMLNGYARSAPGCLSLSQCLIPAPEGCWVPVSIVNRQIGQKTLICCSAPEQNRKFYAEFAQYLAIMGWTVICIDDQRNDDQSELSQLSNQVRTVPGVQHLETVFAWVSKTLQPSRIMALGDQANTSLVNKLQSIENLDAIVVVAKMQAEQASHAWANHYGLAKIYRAWRLLFQPSDPAMGNQDSPVLSSHPLLYIGSNDKTWIAESIRNQAETCWVLQNELGENFRYQAPNLFEDKQFFSVWDKVDRWFEQKRHRFQERHHQ